MKAGRSKDNAVLRTIAGKKNLNFGTKIIIILIQILIIIF